MASIVLGLMVFASFNVATPVTGAGTVVIGTTDSVTSLDPADAYDYWSSNTIVQLTHGLMELPISTSGEILPAVKGPIVDTFTVSDDAKTYIFELKEDIEFSDGEAFDAAAAKYNLDRSRTLDGDPSFLLGNIDTVTASGQTLTIKLTNPDATFLQVLSYTNSWPMSPESLSATEIEGNPDSIPAGLGPYMVDSWTAGVEMQN